MALFHNKIKSLFFILQLYEEECEYPGQFQSRSNISVNSAPPSLSTFRHRQRKQQRASNVFANGTAHELH